YQPEPWTPERVGLLMKFMAWSLSGSSNDLQLTRSRSKLHPSEFDELFPLSLEALDPIVPKGTRWSFESLAPKGPSKEFVPDFSKIEPPPIQPSPGNGSNNWAVTGKKSSTGLPILSNDIHLDLNLPSLWYEIQLHSPKQNVYGVALAGAPGII